MLGHTQTGYWEEFRRKTNDFLKDKEPAMTINEGRKDRKTNTIEGRKKIIWQLELQCYRRSKTRERGVDFT